MKSRSIVATVALVFSLSAAHAQEKPAAGAAAGLAPFVPGFGEFMLLAQARHAKLWLAGNAQNWDLADYLIEELKEGLESAVKHVPMLKDIPVGKMIESTLDEPIADVEKAIKAKDRTRFIASFDKLTGACNTCHQATNRPFIVVQRPATSPFPNQSFAPAKR